MLETILKPELISLRGAFLEHGFDIRLVGGVVRDILNNTPHKDIDLATDATPREQETIYREIGVIHHPTGVQHGTWTVVLNDGIYEITTLRTESNHDGRHATMSWSRDWTEDLSRRDLTINAMSLSFDEELHDPFGGYADLLAKRVRFVGNPVERMREDYLRILRYFRFHGRIAGFESFDADAILAVKECASGIVDISCERIWSEMAKIIVGPASEKMMSAIIETGLAPYIDLPIRTSPWECVTNDPVAAFVTYLANKKQIDILSILWKWSAEDRDRGSYLMSVRDTHLTLDDAKRAAIVAGVSKDWLVELFRIQKRDNSELAAWIVPVFPVLGRDLIAMGFNTGPNMGMVLKRLKQKWIDSGFELDKKSLLGDVRNEI